MKLDLTAYALLHAMVRATYLSLPENEAYISIFKALLPFHVREQFSGQAWKVKQPLLQRICDYLYDLEASESTNVSCLSASLVAQMVAFSHGVPSQLVLGVKKQDQKLVGHAWLELLDSAPTPQIVNPGKAPIADFCIIRRSDPDLVLERFMEARCGFGPCL